MNLLLTFSYPCIFPGCVYARVVFPFQKRLPGQLALWYSKNEMGLRMAYWVGFAAVAGACGGLVGMHRMKSS